MKRLALATCLCLTFSDYSWATEDAYVLPRFKELFGPESWVVVAHCTMHKSTEEGQLVDFDVQETVFGSARESRFALAFEGRDARFHQLIDGQHVLLFLTPLREGGYRLATRDSWARIEGRNWKIVEALRDYISVLKQPGAKESAVTRKRLLLDHLAYPERTLVKANAASDLADLVKSGELTLLAPQEARHVYAILCESRSEAIVYPLLHVLAGLRSKYAAGASVHIMLSFEARYAGPYWLGPILAENGEIRRAVAGLGATPGHKEYVYDNIAWLLGSLEPEIVMPVVKEMWERNPDARDALQRQLGRQSAPKALRDLLRELKTGG